MWRHNRDQDRGGGAGGVLSQSGGFADSAWRYWIAAIATDLPAGLTMPSTFQHLVMQLAASGHFCLVSQHVQSILDVSAPLACIAFMQSLIASSAAATELASCKLARISIAAVAEVIGASANDSAIKIARMARRWCSGWNLQK